MHSHTLIFYKIINKEVNFISIIVLVIVYILISIRQIGRVRLQSWQIMLGGALTVLITRQISFSQAFNSINFDIIIFLGCMFIVGEAFGRSGYIKHLSFVVFKKAKNINQLLLFIIFSLGLLSPFFINDTMVIVSTPLIIYIAKKHNISAKPLLLTMAFAVTTGSVLSPIGNPQNLLIALNSNMENPFLTFFKYLTIPTLINLFVIFIMIKIFFKEHFKNEPLNHIKDEINDEKLTNLSRISFFLTFILIGIKIFTVLIGLGDVFKITYIAVIACLPIVLFSKRRLEIIKNIDYHTLIFFASMFVLMESVWNTGIFQNIVKDMDLNSTLTTLSLSVI